MKAMKSRRFRPETGTGEALRRSLTGVIVGLITCLGLCLLLAMLFSRGSPDWSWRKHIVLPVLFMSFFLCALTSAGGRERRLWQAPLAATLLFALFFAAGTYLGRLRVPGPARLLIPALATIAAMWCRNSKSALYS